MLPPGQQLWVDVGQLIRSQVVDSDGHILSPDAMNGSYELRDLDHPTVGQLYEGKLVVDKTYGHASYGCSNCCGMELPTLDPTPFGGPPDTNNEDFIHSTEQCGGTVDDVTDYGCNWSSSNTAIATLPTSTLHTVAVGTATGRAEIQLAGTHPGPRCPPYIGNPQQSVNVAKVSCTSPVTRGGTSTCTATGPTGSTFSNWKFSDGTNSPVTSSSTNSQWSGTMVTSGTVSVTVTSSTGTATPTAQITVNNRTNFAFTAASPTAESNGFSGDGCSVSVPSPPVKTGDAVGAFCLAQYFSLNTSAVSDGGPNNGYSYVTSVSSSSGSSTTSYFYVISPDLQNASSTFYKAQCGNYNSQTNPNGFISGANLLTDTTRHESGAVQSHYQNYVVAQSSSTNNLGTVAESMTGLESGQVLANSVTGALNQNVQTITSATQVEPCGVQEDASCNFQGFINFQPYQSCN
jgi:hypothetical protein